jgi:hypothetical protein
VFEPVVVAAVVTTTWSPTCSPSVIWVFVVPCRPIRTSRCSGRPLICTVTKCRLPTVVIAAELTNTASGTEPVVTETDTV